LHGSDVRADAHRRRAALADDDDGVDLATVVHRSRVVDSSSGHVLLLVSAQV
jgi:hypothetical protein